MNVGIAFLPFITKNKSFIIIAIIIIKIHKCVHTFIHTYIHNVAVAVKPVKQ